MAEIVKGKWLLNILLEIKQYKTNIEITMGVKSCETMDYKPV